MLAATWVVFIPQGAPPPPAPVQAPLPSAKGSWWLGDGSSERIRAGEAADEEVMEFLILKKERRH